MSSEETTVEHSAARPIATPLAGAPSFIETQFPVARLSMESYKERSAVAGQTLTGLGKWWGRKPLVLVRAAILGLLLPATLDPKRDGEVFLQLMTMDDEGLWERKNTNIPNARLKAELQTLSPAVQKRFLTSDGEVRTFRRKQKAEKEELQHIVFQRMAYDEKLEYCARPEQITGPSAAAWSEINAHLGTNVQTLQALVEELGKRRFGNRPRVGDAFCGGGSIPFEAARLGCDVYASDLNPVAALLTWAALNIIGGGEEVVNQVQAAQRAVYDAVDKQVTEWGIEHNAEGWRADAYLYCVEVKDPDTGWRVPLAPSWVIAEKTNVFARLVPDDLARAYRIEIVEGASDAEMAAARQGTVRNSAVVHPHNPYPVPIDRIRQGMRMWENHDVIPRPGDTFQERLYCVRWVETWFDDEGKERTTRHYLAPDADDEERETEVLALLRQRFGEWQRNGYIPSRRIEPGDETTRLQRERGWTHWHHLFTPRQLLVNGLFAAKGFETLRTREQYAGLALLQNRLANWNSRLGRWLPTQGGGIGGGKDAFYNNALNTILNHTTRGFLGLESTQVEFAVTGSHGNAEVVSSDARALTAPAHIWITDPPYADAIIYDELSEFFIAWGDASYPIAFSDWQVDSRRDSAISGNDSSFAKAMAEAYAGMSRNCPDNGLHMVMFTHQDAGVWADLTTILWASGLHVTAAWTIATETKTGYREGNFVQGTVLLVLRKRTENDPLFEDEVIPAIEAEVRRQLDFMVRIDDRSAPNFDDADYQLAAYAAALRVLTANPIHEINPARELARVRAPGEENPIERIIRNAVKIAADHLVPAGLDGELWRTLEPSERFYLKGLEVESHGEHRSGVYQEFARGFGVPDYDALLATTRANETRLKTATEFGSRQMEGTGFPRTLVRHILAAVYHARRTEDAQAGRNFLRTEMTLLGNSPARFDYWQERKRMVALLDYLGRLRHVQTMPAWQEDANYAHLVSGAVFNDTV